MKRILMLAALMAAGAASPSQASCLFATASDNCSTDGYGNTYRTEENLGGGYNTYRNGALQSQTRQNLSGGYTEEFQSGERRTYNYDPYATERPVPLYGSPW